MNEQTRMETAAPWKHRDKLPRPRPREQVIAALSLVCSILSLLLANYEQIVFFLLIPLTVLGVYLMRSRGGVLVLLIPAVLLSFLTTSLAVAAIYLALVIGTWAIAFSHTTCGFPYLALIPLVGAVVAYFVWNDFSVALLPLMPLPAGLLLAAATLTHQRRTTAICFTVGGLLISLGALLALLLWSACGTLEIGAVTEYLSALRESLTETVLSVRDQFLVYMQESLTAEGVAAAEMEQSLESLRKVLTDDVIRETVSLIFSILPALAVMLCSLVSFVAQLMLSHTYFYTGRRAVLTRDATVFLMSPASAVIYLVTFVCSLFMGAGSLVGAAMQNLCLMLLPGLCVVGIGAVARMLRESRGGARVFLVITLFAAVCCAGFSVFYFLALWGAYTAILTALGQHIVEKMKNINGQDQNGGNDGEE